MNMKKIVVMAFALVAASCVFAHPHGGWGGPHGGWGGPRYHGGYHHHHHSGLGLAAGIVGLTAATAAIAHDIVAPPPVVYTTPTVYPAATYAAPVATTYAAPVATYPVAAPAVVTPAPVVYPAARVVYPRPYYRRWYW